MLTPGSGERRCMYLNELSLPRMVGVRPVMRLMMMMMLRPIVTRGGGHFRQFSSPRAESVPAAIPGRMRSRHAQDRPCRRGWCRSRVLLSEASFLPPRSILGNMVAYLGYNRNHDGPRRPNFVSPPGITRVGCPLSVTSVTCLPRTRTAHASHQRGPRPRRRQHTGRNVFLARASTLLSAGSSRGRGRQAGSCRSFAWSSRRDRPCEEGSDFGFQVMAVRLFPPAAKIGSIRPTCLYVAFSNGAAFDLLPCT